MKKTAKLTSVTEIETTVIRRMITIRTNNENKKTAIQIRKLFGIRRSLYLSSPTY